MSAQAGLRRRKEEKQVGTREDADEVIKNTNKRPTHPRTLGWIQVAVVPLILFFVALGSRLYMIEYPSEVIFDEVHFGNFAAQYVQRKFFFDVHPPLAKLIVALSAWLAGFNGKFGFESIGLDYIEPGVPYKAMRSYLAVIGALHVPLVYSIMRETGFGFVAGLLSALLVLADNAHFVQSRFILLDSPMILFMLMSFYAYIRFYALRFNPFTRMWWTWLCATGICLSLTISCKMVGLFGFFTIGAAVVLDLWDLFDIRHGNSLRVMTRHFCARALFLIVVPVFVYLFWFWVSFAILNRSGSGDDYMSSEFQQTLAGSPLLANTQELHACDVITFKHVGTDRYLFSGLGNYPHKYDDGRISSDGQIVSAVDSAEDGIAWKIVPVDPVNNEDGSFNITRRRIYHGQKLRLLHVDTNAYLMTHDVASPTMPTNEEITTYPAEESTDDFEDSVFQIYFSSSKKGAAWESLRTRFRLVHVPTRVAVWTWEKSLLPDWAPDQYEVNGNKNAKDKTAYWVVDSVVPDPASPMHQTRSKPREARPVQPLPFLNKYLELQRVMFEQNARLTDVHPYSSRPITWPFLVKGVSYWGNDKVRGQIYFIGNVVAWWGGVLGVSLFGALFFLDMLMRRRGVYQIPTVMRQRYLRTTGFFALAWACHYFPFFFMGRQLFLHHYLPAQICSVMVLAGMLEFFMSASLDLPLSRPGPTLDQDQIRSPSRRRTTGPLSAVVLLLLLLAALVFVYLAPLSYGLSMHPEMAQSRKLLPTWQFLYV
ncbi:dolichyl-phosphate-mannose--protein mannosyltransferase [Malassezia vespertilionis]|uniref:Dolichyl-phosphate-mannose--protein mannosyltransferase n=1 Tax=Malassezia vespertilionis TaxID=2020962 RepID=A0A2N1JAV5_9BASI|nr:dolichyl-phosphate-mannose--protein mannosyltransferase [Malassezia vespertilionis]PKI83690.1 hypothetical protein MVES_002315 [Malassezia vespertilionis]WFD07094.1 dolichyl-phosphate-mannose--protein mannosyltransferase [Malassezia vespertilionis]